MRVDDFDYELPERLIAQTPLSSREDSRLLVVDPVEKTTEHRHFRNITEYLRPGDVLVLNNSKVIPARLFGIKTDTGAHIELLLLRPADEPRRWFALTRPAKRLREGTELQIGEGAGQVTARIVGLRDEGIREVEFLTDESVESIADRLGEMPLPPYIHESLHDKDRYQTVYAKTAGSVAAPTAGLHFTERLLDEIREMGVDIRYVTLHVGLGTFRSVQVEDVEAHEMHSEWYEVDKETAAAVNRAKSEGRRVISVGTTALRTLESAGASGKLEVGARETDIFIYPGYEFRIADALITNFHLPKSTLFMLVSAWMGTDFAKQVYKEAVEHEYRFFSFGDAMFLSRRGTVDSTSKV
ncbi:tRNA preQ1(34) S-adenosylmethionine ribosyltransferase-isomerase QueA [Alicyclobacillus dauci]|uniref:S-adenosylmethionine:tRNA ribosyltransferase-isomerase n=1 Tax=Alicyclobacillus dauci TaxID=1475485 RepID=A0ABY6Z6Q0_9BACL|nr:tRNA preQ1(34) S-adenosylmethionine ribosyltransferase-isomerase QueA [Alicyclobacillus dauci]WAH38425.1 tRNA preQ1(34) S-adenosylmethionine ribosyltransferase-isomerase QueA [Alicyclobacillus dauci]